MRSASLVIIVDDDREAAVLRVLREFGASTFGGYESVNVYAEPAARTSGRRIPTGRLQQLDVVVRTGEGR